MAYSEILLLPWWFVFLLSVDESSGRNTEIATFEIIVSLVLSIIQWFQFWMMSWKGKGYWLDWSCICSQPNTIEWQLRSLVQPLTNNIFGSSLSGNKQGFNTMHRGLRKNKILLLRVKQNQKGHGWSISQENYAT